MSTKSLWSKHVHSEARALHTSRNQLHIDVSFKPKITTNQPVFFVLWLKGALIIEFKYDVINADFQTSHNKNEGYLNQKRFGGGL